MVKLILFHHWQDNIRVTDKNGCWLKRIEDKAFQDWLDTVPIGQLLMHFLSLPPQAPPKTPSADFDWRLETNSKRVDQMARDFWPVKPDFKNALIEKFEGDDGFNNQIEEAKLKNLHEESFKLRKTISFAQTVYLLPNRYDVTRYVYDSVLHPIEEILNHLGVYYKFKSEESISLNGYTMMPDVVCGRYEKNDKGKTKFMINCVVVMRQVGLNIGFGVRCYLEGNLFNEEYNSSVESFLEAFNEGVQLCAIAKCSSMLITNGIDFVFINLKKPMLDNKSNDYKTDEGLKIPVAKYWIVNSQDAVYTVRSCVLISLLLLFNPLNTFDSSDYYFNIFKKTQYDKNKDRVENINYQWEQGIQSNNGTYERVFVNIEECILDEINIGYGLWSQTLRLDVTEFPQEVKLGGDKNINTAVCCIFDPYYYHHVDPESDMKISAIEWFKREISFYRKLAPLQEICIPTLYGYGILQDVWEEEVSPSRYLYNGPFILLEDLSNVHPTPGNPEHFDSASRGLKLLHSMGVQHNNLSLDTMLMRLGDVMFINLEHCTVIEDESLTDQLYLKSLWPQFEGTVNGEEDEEEKIDRSVAHRIPTAVFHTVFNNARAVHRSRKFNLEVLEEL